MDINKRYSTVSWHTVIWQNINEEFTLDWLKWKIKRIVSWLLIHEKFWTCRARWNEENWDCIEISCMIYDEESNIELKENLSNYNLEICSE